MENSGHIGTRIEKIKNHFNYSNGKLGEVCDVSYAAIAKIINGSTKDPGISIIINLVKKLKVNSNWLLFNEGSMFSADLKESRRPAALSDKSHDNEIFNLLLRSKDEENEILKKMVKLLEDRLAEIQERKKAS
jgi:hypothetical protein